MGGGEAAFLLEARLERDFRELQRFNDIIITWRRATGHVESQTPAHWPIGEELKRASRKVGGFWSRIILLYQNGQLRSDIFMHSSPWLERSKFFKAVAEPLDTQIRLQEPLIPLWAPMSLQPMPPRPHSFRALEELHWQAEIDAGGDVLRGYITDRRQRLRKGDEDALTRYRATITDGKVHSGAPPSLGSYGLEEAMRLTPKTPAGADKGARPPSAVNSEPEPEQRLPVPQNMPRRLRKTSAVDKVISNHLEQQPLRARFRGHSSPESSAELATPVPAPRSVVRELSSGGPASAMDRTEAAVLGLMRKGSMAAEQQLRQARVTEQPDDAKLSAAVPPATEHSVAQASHAPPGENVPARPPTDPLPAERTGSAAAAGLQQMHSVRVCMGDAQQLASGETLLDLQLDVAKQQRSMSIKSVSSGPLVAFLAANEAEPDSENPFFEIRGPASSPEQLLKHATLFLLGQSPNATAADLGVLPLSRAATEPLSGQAPASPDKADPEAPAAAGDMRKVQSARAPEPEHQVPADLAAACKQAADSEVAAAPEQTAAPPAVPRVVPMLSPAQSEPSSSVREQLSVELPSEDTFAFASSLITSQSSAEQPAGAEARNVSSSSSDTPTLVPADPLPKQTKSTPSSSVTPKKDEAAAAKAKEATRLERRRKDEIAAAKAKAKASLEAGRAERKKERKEKQSSKSRPPSSEPATPDQSMEYIPGGLRRQGSMSGPLSGDSFGSATLSKKASQLAEQLQRGNPMDKITAARRLQKVAAKDSKAGDAIWEADGVVPLTAMLVSPDPEHFRSAAAAIAALANPQNRAFQIGVGEAGGVKSLLVSLGTGDDAKSAQAARALTAVICGTPALQENLLVAGGAPILVKQLCAPAGMDSTSSDELKRQQREGLQPAKEIAEEGTCRQAEVAATITAFATNFARGQKAIVSASGLSRLTQLLFSSRPSVQEKALCALLACTAKNAEFQAQLTEAGVLPPLKDFAERAPAQAEDVAKASAHVLVMAQKALELLYTLACYFANHDALQAAGCLEVLVAAMMSADFICAQHAIWAVQSLTAGGSNIEKGLCSAGAIPTLLSLIRRCLEHPQQVSSKKLPRPLRGAAAQSPLLEPGVAALSNLAVESAAVKDDMREAGAIETCVQLLQSEVVSVRGHAARALWNLTSKNETNKSAAREAGAIPLLVAMLDHDTTKQGNGKRAGAAEEAAGTVGSMAADNSPNQGAFRAAGALPLLLNLILSADKPIKASNDVLAASHGQEQAAWAMNALTLRNDSCMEELVSLDMPARLMPLLTYPELWNWTPVVSTMQNLSAGPERAKKALVRADAAKIFVDILSMGRPTLQTLAATAVGNLGCTGDEDFKSSFQTVGGLDKLTEIVHLLHAPAALRKAASRALADITTGRPESKEKKSPKLRFKATNILRAKRWGLGA